MQKIAAIIFVFFFSISATCFSQNDIKADKFNTRILVIPKEGSLSRDLIKRFENSVTFDSSTKGSLNAISNNKLDALSLNRDIISSHNNFYSNKIPAGKITNQNKSGRCWIFAALNIIRPVLMKKLNIDNIEFSQNYLFFWDKMEKANLFLESIISTVNLETSDKKLRFILQDPFADGGQWNFAVALINKYGLVTKNAMEDTSHCTDSTNMDSVLTSTLRQYAAQLRKFSRMGKSEKELRAVKEEMLQTIYKMMTMCLGIPPKKFEFRYEDKNKKSSIPKIYTPVEFYQNVVGVNLNDYVCFYSSPTWEYNKLYQIELNRNMAEIPNLTFININIKDIKPYALKSLQNDELVWFACDVSKDTDRLSGIMCRNLFEYKNLFGVKIEMSKDERILYYDTSANHAMVFTGVDIFEGKPRKWLVENSWGKDRGDDGFFSMYDSWFDEFVYEIVLHKKYLPSKILDILKTTPVVLPEDDPLRSLISSDCY